MSIIRYRKIKKLILILVILNLIAPSHGVDLLIEGTARLTFFVVNEALVQPTIKGVKYTAKKYADHQEEQKAKKMEAQLQALCETTKTKIPKFTVETSNELVAGRKRF
jgi:hypothetical protein